MSESNVYIGLNGADLLANLKLSHCKAVLFTVAKGALCPCLFFKIFISCLSCPEKEPLKLLSDTIKTMQHTQKIKNKLSPLERTG